jgi:hypothetical protein
LCWPLFGPCDCEYSLAHHTRLRKIKSRQGQRGQNRSRCACSVGIQHDNKTKGREAKDKSQAHKMQTRLTLISGQWLRPLVLLHTASKLSGLATDRSIDRAGWKRIASAVCTAGGRGSAFFFCCSPSERAKIGVKNGEQHAAATWTNLVPCRRRWERTRCWRGTKHVRTGARAPSYRPPHTHIILPLTRRGSLANSSLRRPPAGSSPSITGRARRAFC